MKRLFPLLVVGILFISGLSILSIPNPTNKSFKNLEEKSNNYSQLMKIIGKHVKNFNHKKLMKWIDSINLTGGGDKEIRAGDFIDGKLSHFKEENYEYEKLKEIESNENREIYRTELLNKDIIKEEWKYLTENRKRWEIVHFLHDLENFKKKYIKEDKFYWFSKNWYNDGIIEKLEWLCYELNGDIDNWKLAYFIEYGIKKIDDMRIGPLNNNSISKSNIRAGLNVTLHIVDYYSDTSDCYSGNDIYMKIYMGSDSWEFDGPSNTDSWSGDATFTTSVTSSTLSITIHVYEADSGLCGSDDDYGSATMTYNLNTKTWSGDSSVPFVHTSGPDGHCDVWFYIESDSDNNPDLISSGTNGAGYLITQYNGKSNYNDPQDRWEFTINSQDVSNQISIVFTMTPNTNGDFDLYLYDPNNNLITSSTNAGDGVTENCVYRLQPGDPTGNYYVQISLSSGYGSYTFYYALENLHDVTVTVTGLVSETSTITYHKFGNQYQVTLSSTSPTFEDYCDDNSLLTVSVPSGLYTYDPTSYTITQDSTYFVHFYRYPTKIVINELSCVGTGNDEWVELYNNGTEDVYLNGWVLTDQDGNDYKIPNQLEPMPPGKYLLIYSGSGTNSYSFASGYAQLYSNFGSVWNDDGDDVLLEYNGYYFDYVVYWRSTGSDVDIDSPPSSLNFIYDGSGNSGCLPAPYYGGSVSLIPNGVDTDHASDWYITNGTSSTPGEANANILIASGESHSPNKIGVGSDDTYIEKINLTSRGGNIGLSQINVHLVGNATDSDLSHIKLYEDSNGNGEFDSGDYLLRNTTFSSSVAIFSNLGLTIYDRNYTTLFITVDVTSSSSAYWHVFHIEIGDNDIIISNPKDMISISPSIVSNDTEIVPTDTAPPYVTDAYINPSTEHNGKIYVNGNFTIDFTFNKDMNTGINPTITISTTTITTGSGYWTTSKIWHQQFWIMNSYEGDITITIKDAKDLAGNIMISYSVGLFVDNAKPYISSYSPMDNVISSNFTLMIYFSEGMDESVSINIVVNPPIMSMQNERWIDSQTYGIDMIVLRGVENYVNIDISGASDIAGNSMREKTISYYVDTKNPYILFYSINPNKTVNGNMYVSDNFTLLAKYNEDMNTSTMPSIVTDSQLSVKNESWIDSRTLVSSINLNGNIEENATIEITGGKDKSGNIQIKYNFTFRIDNIPPDIMIKLDRVSPMSEGYLNISVIFNEKVDEKNTTFRYGINNSNTINGIWKSETEWSGTIKIEKNWENGKYEVKVNAYDIAGNSQSSYTYFYVDTKSPTANILEPKLKITGKGVINITVKFSESMKQDTIYVLLGSKPVKGSWTNSTMWKGKYDIENEYGEMQLQVYGARDLAGNLMNRVTKNIIADTKGPKIDDVIYEGNVAEGSKIIIRAEIKDDYSNVSSATLWYKSGSSDTYIGVKMEKYNGFWTAYIPSNSVIPPTIDFYIETQDSLGNKNTTENYSIDIIPWYIVDWWLWLLLGILILLFIIFLIRRKKRREKAKIIPLKGGFKERMKRKEDDEFFE